jgi:DNA polymerase (family 10)
MSSNAEVAEILSEIAELLSIKGDRYRSRAYAMASQRIRGLLMDVEKLKERGSLKDIPGVGESISQVIVDYLERGEVPVLEKLRESLPMGVIEMMELEGIGPKSAMRLNKELGITSLDLLEKGAKNHEIRELRGFGEKKEENILVAIEAYRARQSRFLLGEVLPVIRDILHYMFESDAVSRVEMAGSARRRMETVGDLDLLVSSNKPRVVTDHFIDMPWTRRIIQEGETKSTVILDRQLQVDLRLIPPGAYGAALQYFTGSKEHNVKLRTLAIQEGYKLSEYGLFDRETNELVEAETEEAIYRRMGMPWIPPELRENRGEIEAALEDRLPKLVDLEDIRGDLHVHTSWSEGRGSIREMAIKAIEMGWEYIAITDHSKALGVANGLDEGRLRKQIKEIESLNEGMDNFTILTGIECDIMADGSMDLPNSVLWDLDWVVGSVHSGMRQDEDVMTNRLLKAIHNPYINVIGHPTGRLIQKRRPYRFNSEEVFTASAEQGVMMEINAYPNRLDLNDTNSRSAASYGVKLAIGSDSHDTSQMEFLPMGVGVARRGWLEKEDIVNTLKVDEVKGLRK